ncbi:hypothetical protein ACHAXR_000583 [Thalassiosira sp. AJA248-18]
MNSDWATDTDPRTCHSFGGHCLRFAGGTVAYKSCLQPPITLSSTAGEFTEAADSVSCGTLAFSQCPASIAYEDNNARTVAMANAQKPTSCARHMNIKHLERDLIKLEHVNTTLKLADHFTPNNSVPFFSTAILIIFLAMSHHNILPVSRISMVCYKNGNNNNTHDYSCSKIVTRHYTYSTRSSCP